jgi:hypothetical protein
VKGSDIAQAAAAATAVIGVVTSLAVTGVLGQAQRNHGNLLLVAFSIVLFAALWWTLAAVIPDTHPVLLSIGAGVFLIGLGFAIAAMIATQHDSERPSVSPDSYDSSKRVLKTTVKADGLAADKRIVVLAEGLIEKKTQRPNGTPAFRLVPSPQPLYFAVIGPNSDGKVEHTARLVIPKRYQLVGVKAWTGKTETGCLINENPLTLSVAAHERDGCFVLRLPAQPPSNKASK